MTGLGVGIIGPGAIADFHAAAISDLGGTVVAAAGPNRDDLDAFATRHDVPRSFERADDLLACADVEAVIVAAPSDVHAELATAALEAGKPVLCEVPLAMSLAEGEAVVRLAQQRGLPLGVAHTTRYWEPHRRLVAELQDSGRPAVHVLVRSLMLRQTDVGWTGKQRDWTDSAVWHHGSHAVDTALWLLGDLPVVASAKFGPPSRGGQPMDASVQLSTDDSRLASVELSYNAHRAKADYLVITGGETFEIFGANLVRNDEVLIEGDVAATQNAAIVAQDDAFLRAVSGDARDLYSGADALPTLAVLEGLRTYP